MATEQDIADWTGASGRDWDQLCQAWIWNLCDQFGTAPVAYGSALDAYYASDIVSSDVWNAPPGAIIYLDIGVYGHVTLRVDDGQDGMASSHVAVFWGINAGRVSLSSYIAQTGAQPLGWAYANGANSFPFEPAGGGSTPQPPNVLEEIDMDRAVIVHRVNASGGLDNEWSLIGATVPGGVRVTTSQSTANRWARMYGGSVAGLKRDEYIAQQNEARALAASWLDQQRAIQQGD